MFARVKVFVDVTRELRDRIDILAMRRRMTRSELVRHAIRVLQAVCRDKKKGDYLVLMDRDGNEKRRIENF